MATQSPYCLDHVAPPEGSTGSFPTTRLRRLRAHPKLRALIRETRLDPQDFVLPLFVRPGRGVRQPIQSMPGHAQLSVDLLAAEARECEQLGIPAVILFGIPEHKDATGSAALDDDGIIPQAIQAIKEATPDLITITDLCFCEYTDHGHCGMLGGRRTAGGGQQLANRAPRHASGSSPSGAAAGQASSATPTSPHPALSPRGGESAPSATRGDLPTVDVANDPTLELLARQALVHARAGADVIAPSGMMDGMVAAVRRALDAEGFEHLPILSYAAKYASSFYGPFREAAESAPQFGDRRGYQMDPANAAEALREVQLDIAEGADIVMVKPALVYLDVIRRVRDAFPGVPLAAYNTSGEYAMLKAAATNGWLDERAAALEMLTAIKRAGADFILTYFAKDAARWLAGRQR